MFSLVRTFYMKHLAEHLHEYSEGKVYTGLNNSNYPTSIRGIAAGIESMRMMIKMFYVNTGASTGKVKGAVQEMNHALQSAAENVNQAVRFSDMAHSIAEDIVKSSAEAEKEVMDIKNSAAIIASVAEEIHGDSADIKSLCETAFKAIEQATSAFLRLSEASVVMSKKVDILTENTKDIDSLLSVIQDIASQTDMLALNAAIEAARAGDHGRGFSIVADEIQKLSGEASRAADSANSLLAKVNRGIYETSSFVKDGEITLKTGAESLNRGRNGIGELLEKSVSIEKKTYSAKNAALEQLNSTAVIAEFSGKTVQTCRSATGYTEEVTSLMSVQRKLFDDIREMGSSLDRIADDLVSTSGSITITKSDEINSSHMKRRIDSLSVELKQTADTLSVNGINIKLHTEKLNSILKTNSDIEAAWTNSADGRFIVSIPPAGIANAGGRDWFVNAIKGGLYISRVYISAISKNPCITISLPISSRGIITGVLGVDLKIS